MCMITFVPAGLIPGTANFSSVETRADDAHWINDDGHGFMIATPEGVWSHKGMSFDIVWGRYEALLDLARDKFGNVPSAFHSRIGTAGPNDSTLCHPFLLGEGEPFDVDLPEVGEFTVRTSTTALMHNGILPTRYQPEARNKVDSDTSLYVRDYLPFWINEKTGVPGRRAAARIGGLIGTGNKFVVFGSVDGQVKVRVINQDSGTWEDDGAWYSSQYYSRTPAWRMGGYGSYTGYTGYSGGKFKSDPPANKCVDSTMTKTEAEAADLEESMYEGWWRPKWKSLNDGAGGGINAYDFFYVKVEEAPADIHDADAAAYQDWLADNAPDGRWDDIVEDGDGVIRYQATGKALEFYRGAGCERTLADGEACTGRLRKNEQNYCEACGGCGDCSEVVASCNCLTDAAKPAYAWRAAGIVVG